MSKTTKAIAPETLLKDADFSKASQFEKSHRQIKTLNDPRFGEINILQNASTRQVVAVREKKVTDKNEAGRLILAARNRMNLKNPYLVNLLDYSVTKQSELCSSFYVIKYFFEYPRTDLRKLVADREKSGQTLSSQELTNILYQQNQAQAYLQSQGLAHGDLQPLFIGYDPERMESKLIDKAESLPNDQAIITAQKNRLISGQPLYMSPVMYSNLKKGNTKFQFDRNKEDSFALGLMLLEAGNGQSIQNIYDSKTGQVNQAILSQHLDSFNKKFGGSNSLLTSHVSSMTNLNEAARPSPTQIQSSLPPFEEIKNRFAEGSTNASYAYGQTGSNSQSQFGLGSSVNQGAISAYPIGTSTLNQQVIQGGDTKTIVTIKKDMPVVEENLFAFDTIDLPASVQASQVQWDPSLGTPKTIEVPSARYNFIAAPSKPQFQEFNTSATYNSSQAAVSQPVQEDLFSTFANTKPAKAYAPAQVDNSQAFASAPKNDNTLVYGGDNGQTFNEYNNNYNQFGGSASQHKVYGERAVGNDPNADFSSKTQTQTETIITEVHAPAQTQYIAQAPAHTQLISQAPAQNQVVTTSYSYTTSAPLNQSGAQVSSGSIIPSSMRNLNSSQDASALGHTFRLYDSTLTHPEVIQVKGSSNPAVAQISVKSETIPGSTGSSYSNTITTAPANTTTSTTHYVNEAPVSYTTYSQSNVPSNKVISYAAPTHESISYAAPAGQTITYGAPLTETYYAAPYGESVSYAGSGAQRISYASPINETVHYSAPANETISYTGQGSQRVSYASPFNQSGQVVYSQSKYTENPTTTYQTIESQGNGRKSLSGSQVIHSSYVTNPELQGLKLIGTYTEDQYANVKHAL